jgi:hypothetical protein
MNCCSEVVGWVGEGELSVVGVSSAPGVFVEAGAKAVGVRVLSGGCGVAIGLAGPAGVSGAHAAKSRVVMYKKYSKVLLFIFFSSKIVACLWLQIWA